MEMYSSITTMLIWTHLDRVVKKRKRKKRKRKTIRKQCFLFVVIRKHCFLKTNQQRAPLIHEVVSKRRKGTARTNEETNKQNWLSFGKTKKRKKI